MQSAAQRHAPRSGAGGDRGGPAPRRWRHSPRAPRGLRPSRRRRQRGTGAPPCVAGVASARRARRASIASAAFARRQLDRQRALAPFLRRHAGAEQQIGHVWQVERHRAWIAPVPRVARRRVGARFDQLLEHAGALVARQHRQQRPHAERPPPPRRRAVTAAAARAGCPAPSPAVGRVSPSASGAEIAPRSSDASDASSAGSRWRSDDSAPKRLLQPAQPRSADGESSGCDEEPPPRRRRCGNSRESAARRGAERRGAERGGGEQRDDAKTPWLRGSRGDAICSSSASTTPR